ncbi:MAG: AsmA family protein [Gammaproteobacteria bacterium]|nr:AsmA family protein [Gammaproteobacteria bacterium]MDH3505756.1 AsmA family protein [Gammaproteobacteria bacterium]
MRKFLKILGAAIAATVALGAVAAIIIWLTFDPNDYKGYIADWVESRTGREFIIEDDLELMFFPWLGVTTGNVRLGNAPGFGEDPFASVDSLSVSVQLMPLLRRQVEIGTVSLGGLELNLAIDAEGLTNWSDLVAAESTDVAPATTNADREPFLQSLNIAGIDIDEGLIFWRENTSDVRYVFSELSVETGAIAPGQPVDSELSFRLVSVEPQLSAEIDASGTTVIDTARNTVETRDLRVGFNLADGRGNERAAGALQLDNLRVALAENDIGLSRGNLTAALTSPPIGPEEAEVRIDWSSMLLERESAALSVTGLATEFAGMSAVWDLSGANLFEQPELTGSVRVAPQPLASVIDTLALEIDETATTNLGNVDLQAAFTLLPLTRQASLSDIAANLLGMTVSGEITTSENGVMSGRLATNEFDPAQALSLVPQETLARIDVSALGPVTAAGSIEYNPATQQLSVQDFDIGALGTNLNGNVSRLEGGQGFAGNVTIPALDAAALARVLGELMPAGLPPDALGDLALSTEFAYAAGAADLTALEARAAGLDLQGALRVTSLADSPNWTGRIEVLPFDPRALLERFDRPMPARVDPTAFQNIRATAQIEGNASRNTFRNLNVVLDDSTVTGELTVSLAPQNAYAFDLAIDRLDADRYMPASAEPPPPQGAAPVAAEIALPTDILHNQRFDGTFEVGALTITGLELQDVSAALAVGGGRGVIDSARAALYGGEFEGGLELDARGDSPTLSLDGTATSVEIEPLLADLRGEANMSGTGSFDLNLTGSGEVLSAVLESTAGNIAFSLRDGLIRGVDVGNTLCTVYNARERLPRPARPSQPVTRYRLLRAGAEVVEGIARTEDLEATTDFMTVSGRGQSSLVSREINYNLIATLTNSVGIDGCETMDPLIGRSIPMRATGAITAPEIEPDYGEILRDRVRDQLEDRLRERLGL